MRILGVLSDGAVAQRIMNSLLAAGSEKIKELLKNGCFSRKRIDPTDCTCLLYEAIPQYARASESSICYYFFNTDVPPMPSNPKLSTSVCAILNDMTDDELLGFFDLCKSYFVYPPLPNIAEYSTPSLRLQFAIDYKFDAPKIDFINAAMQTPLSDAAKNSLLTWARGHWNTDVNFTTDGINEISQLIGVSLHWVLGLKEDTLFCRSVLADNLFDWYSLLREQEQGDFIRLLMQAYLVRSLSPAAMTLLDVCEEGSV